MFLLAFRSAEASVRWSVELPKKKSKNLLTGVRVSLISPRMKLLRSSLAILLAAGFSANAQTATTDPVGFVSYTVNANSDQPLGTPMTPAAAFQAQSASVSGVNVGASDVPSFVGVNYLLVTSGPAAGSWEQISSSTSSSIVLNAPITGFTTGNSFVVRAFWTLSTLMPADSGFPISSDPFNASAVLFAYDPMATGINQSSSAAYFYYDGSQGGDPGWYVNGDPGAGLQNNVVLSPDVSITVRNLTASVANIVFVGSVPAQKFGLRVASSTSGPQDNLIYNQFPATVTLSNSGLVSSGAVTPSSDPFNATDIVLTYALGNTGINPASESAFFYYDGSQGGDPGWYVNGDPGAGLQNSVELPAGSAFTIRKGQTASPTSVDFAPPLPYNLN
jgi:uncharacterized protein (TIGR02597 family)